MTGRPSAPRNIAYDNYGREFVFRQPIDEKELAGIMSADSEEVFACYRFDGLERWTVSAVDAWHETSDVVLGWVRYLLGTETDSEILDGLHQYDTYMSSESFREYIASFRSVIAAGEPPPMRR